MNLRRAAGWAFPVPKAVQMPRTTLRLILAASLLGWGRGLKGSSPPDACATSIPENGRGSRPMHMLPKVFRFIRYILREVDACLALAIPPAVRAMVLVNIACASIACVIRLLR